MTRASYGVGACIVSTATIPANSANKAIAAAVNRTARPGSRCLLRVRNGEAFAKSAGRILVVATFASTFAAAKVDAKVATTSIRPADFANASPFRTRSKQRDPGRAVLFTAAAIALLALLAGIVAVLTMHAPTP